jgi:diaminohydroxyphosphoribosylaminopyrimidine deaminase/5-amino-6-(5-phosphoribosylamino)uracil reductase
MDSTTPYNIIENSENERFMFRCLQLARYGNNNVAPNPMVGALVVHNGQIIGEGFHHRFGDAHAEPNAIRAVENPELLKESTLYVSLEPCSHYGKTPPCADLIVRSGIPKVVIGTVDPNPKVAGRGIEIMRKAGITIKVGVIEEQCRVLNKRFFTFHQYKRPYVFLKWAQTHDGFLDILRTKPEEPPLQISNRITKLLTHKIRSENQSILVSTNTVLLDNPSLTVRNWGGKNPIRLAIDRKNRIPAHYHLLDGNVRTIIFSESPNYNISNVEYISMEGESINLNILLQKIYERNIHSILVEGGSKLLNSFIESGLWDEANVEVSPEQISIGIPAPTINLQPVSRQNIEGHEWMSFLNPTKKINV